MATVVLSFVTFSCSYHLASCEASARLFAAMCTWQAPRVVWILYFFLYNPPLHITGTPDCKLGEREKATCALTQGRLLCIAIEPCREANLCTKIFCIICSLTSAPNFLYIYVKKYAIWEKICTLSLRPGTAELVRVQNMRLLEPKHES